MARCTLQSELRWAGNKIVLLVLCHLWKAICGQGCLCLSLHPPGGLYFFCSDIISLIDPMLSNRCNHLSSLVLPVERWVNKILGPQDAPHLHSEVYESLGG